MDTNKFNPLKTLKNCRAFHFFVHRCNVYHNNILGKQTRKTSGGKDDKKSSTPTNPKKDPPPTLPKPDRAKVEAANAAAATVDTVSEDGGHPKLEVSQSKLNLIQHNADNAKTQGNIYLSHRIIDSG